MKPDEAKSGGTEVRRLEVVAAPAGIEYLPQPRPAREVMTNEDLAAEWLKRRVESLSDLAVMWSRSAYTARRTTHTIFANGAVKEEGAEERLGPDRCALDMAADTFDAIKALRGAIEGPAGLVWRCEPEVTRENGAVRVYARLCFEPEVLSA